MDPLAAIRIIMQKKAHSVDHEDAAKANPRSGESDEGPAQVTGQSTSRQFSTTTDCTTCQGCKEISERLRAAALESSRLNINLKTNTKKMADQPSSKRV